MPPIHIHSMPQINEPFAKLNLQVSHTETKTAEIMCDAEYINNNIYIQHEESKTVTNMRYHHKADSGEPGTPLRPLQVIGVPFF